MPPTVQVLIPTYNRPAALAVLLTSLIGQTFQDFGVIVSDQSSGDGAAASGEVTAVRRVLEAHGAPVVIHRHLPRRGMAEQRQFLLEQSGANYVLYLDDDLILENYVIAALLQALREESCGFSGMGLIGLSFHEDVRPHQQLVEFWEGPVRPETITPGSPAWERYTLHNAANLLHLQRRLDLSPGQFRKYKVAWSGGCVLYEREKLLNAGGFSFWKELPPEHAGEDVLAQLRVMSLYGGCGLLPSGAYHQELPTTVQDRRVDAPRVLPVSEPPAGGQPS